MVAADVNRAVARVQSAAARVVQADRALRTGIITFNGHLEGLGQTRRLENVLVLTFRPQEAVYSLELLNVAFNEYFTTVAEYNRAQFDLFHALGYPARELTQLRPPGEALPVDTVGRPTCPRWATGRPRPPDDRRASFRVAFSRHDYFFVGTRIMISLARCPGSLLRKAAAVAMMAWGFLFSSVLSHGDDHVAAAPKVKKSLVDYHSRRRGPAAGTLGYGPPGIYPGFQGFGLGYHLGYGYGGDALGSRAEASAGAGARGSRP